MLCERARAGTDPVTWSRERGGTAVPGADVAVNARGVTVDVNSELGAASALAAGAAVAAGIRAGAGAAKADSAAEVDADASEPRAEVGADTDNAGWDDPSASGPASEPEAATGALAEAVPGTGAEGGRGAKVEVCEGAPRAARSATRMASNSRARVCSRVDSTAPNLASSISRTATRMPSAVPCGEYNDTAMSLPRTGPELSARTRFVPNTLPLVAACASSCRPLAQMSSKNCAACAVRVKYLGAPPLARVTPTAAAPRSANAARSASVRLRARELPVRGAGVDSSLDGNGTLGDIRVRPESKACVETGTPGTLVRATNLGWERRSLLGDKSVSSVRRMRNLRPASHPDSVEKHP